MLAIRHVFRVGETTCHSAEGDCGRCIIVNSSRNLITHNSADSFARALRCTPWASISRDQVVPCGGGSWQRAPLISPSSLCPKTIHRDFATLECRPSHQKTRTTSNSEGLDPIGPADDIARRSGRGKSTPAAVSEIQRRNLLDCE